MGNELLHSTCDFGVDQPENEGVHPNESLSLEESQNLMVLLEGCYCFVKSMLCCQSESLQYDCIYSTAGQ